MVAIITDATEHTKNIFALSINTKITEHITFIDVNTSLLFVWVWMHETHLTVTLEGPRVIKALAIFTTCRVLRTLINILTEETITPEPGITHTLERPVSVDALSVTITTSIVGEALIDITTHLAITCQKNKILYPDTYQGILLHKMTSPASYLYKKYFLYS